MRQKKRKQDGKQCSNRFKYSSLVDETDYSRSISHSPWLVVLFDANKAPPPIFCSVGIKGEGCNGCIKHKKLAGGQLQDSLVVYYGHLHLYIK
jgi:hypothetical protein